MTTPGLACLTPSIVLTRHQIHSNHAKSQGGSMQQILDSKALCTALSEQHIPQPVHVDHLSCTHFEPKRRKETRAVRWTPLQHNGWQVTASHEPGSIFIRVHMQLSWIVSSYLKHQKYRLLCCKCCPTQMISSAKGAHLWASWPPCNTLQQVPTPRKGFKFAQTSKACIQED